MNKYSLLLPFLIAIGFTSPTYAASIVIDRTAVNQFNNIPANYIQAAKNLRLYWKHASTGMYISQGLNCLERTEYEDNSACTIYPENYYDRANWLDETWNPTCYDSSCKINQFDSWARANVGNFDVAMMKFCYVDYGMLPPEYDGTPNSYKATMRSLQHDYPSKTFVLWTAALSDTGYTTLELYNKDIRDYSSTQSGFLFDVADIEKAYGIRDHPQFPDQTTILAKAIWVLMARIAGWNPSGPNPTPTPTIIRTDYRTFQAFLPTFNLTKTIFDFNLLVKNIFN